MKLDSFISIALIPVAVAAASLTASEVAAQTAPRFACPVKGGSITYAQGAKANSLDQQMSNTVSTRNIALNIYESLMTRDVANAPIPELAESVSTSNNGLVHTFKLRRGIKFHNGKEMSSAGVLDSYERYKRVGWEKATFTNVEKWSAPEANTFAITLKIVQPTFLEDLSWFVVPIGSLKFLAPPQNTYKPASPEQADKVFEAAWKDMLGLPNTKDRHAAFARAQYRVMEQGMGLPFGATVALVGTRTDVKNFKPYLIPRFSNVYVQK